MQRTTFLTSLTLSLLLVLSISVIYLIVTSVPVSSRPGCIYFQAVEYCTTHASILCSSSSFMCFIHYLAGIVTNLFWIFTFSGVAFITLRVFLLSEKFHYNDVQHSYYLSALDRVRGTQSSPQPPSGIV